MTKLNFLLSLHEKIKALPREEAEERLRFYSEMIEDRMEEGLSEEEAVSAVGSVDEIAAQILCEIPAVNPKKHNRPRYSIWTIILLILGSPIWLSLLVSAFAVLLSLYISLWAVVISLWAVFGSLIGCAFAGIITGIVLPIAGHSLPGIVLISAGLVCAGLSVFFFFGCKAATKGSVQLATKAAAGIKHHFLNGVTRNG